MSVIAGSLSLTTEIKDRIASILVNPDFQILLKHLDEDIEIAALSIENSKTLSETANHVAFWKALRYVVKRLQVIPEAYRMGDPDVRAYRDGITFFPDEHPEEDFQPE